MLRPLLIPGEASFPDKGIIGVGLRVGRRGDPSLGVLRMFALRDICCPLDGVLKTILHSLKQNLLITKQRNEQETRFELTHLKHLPVQLPRP